VRVQPGATVRQVNARLSRYGRKLGPDPASEIACTIGGVIANNSSGMACGTDQNTYRTLESMVLVLPSGTVIDTGDEKADETLLAREPELWAGLLELTKRVRANTQSVDTIRRLFSMKNVMGYGVNALLDFDRPVDVLAHLMIGSEGTLGFVAEATFRTVHLLPEAATGLAIFPTLAAATKALPRLVASGLATIELMDATSLRVAQKQPGTTPELVALQVRGHAALLVEFQASNPAELGGKVPQQRPADRRLAANRSTRPHLRPSDPCGPVAHPKGPVYDGRRCASVGNDGTSGRHRGSRTSSPEYLRRTDAVI